MSAGSFGMVKIRGSFPDSRPILRRLSAHGADRASLPGIGHFLCAGERTLTRRLTPTPLVADLGVAGCAIRLETNSPAILRLAGNALGRRPTYSAGHKRFRWRLIRDDDPGVLQLRAG